MDLEFLKRENNVDTSVTIIKILLDNFNKSFKQRKLL